MSSAYLRLLIFLPAILILACASSSSAIIITNNYTGAFPGSSDGKESACSAGDPGSIPGLGRSPREENDNPHIPKGLCFHAGLGKCSAYVSPLLLFSC